MKVIAGTLYCGEGDYEKCVEAIQSQDYPLEHFTIADTEEALAHYQLYSAIKSKQADVLVKVDADMVLKDSGIIRKCVQQIQNGFLKITYLVDDFFTNQPIQGMHAYSSKIKVPDKSYFLTKIPKHPDRIPIDRKRTKRIDEVVALHCYHANKKQAFHFGFHRYLKKSNDKCKNLFRHWQKNNHPLLRHACLGMWVAYKNRDTNIYCYGDDFDEFYESNKDGSVTHKNIKEVVDSL